jgi:hypothetical protein
VRRGRCSFATVAIITAARLVDGRLNATWAFLGLGVGLLICGLLTHAWRLPFGLPLQTVGLLGFGGAAAIALAISPDLGAYDQRRLLPRSQPTVPEEGFSATPRGRNLT